jgi:predicted permease
MVFETVVRDVRYALRSVWRSPLFAAGVAATIGLGLGLFCSAFTILNAYVLKPIDLPNPHELYGLSWDTNTTRRNQFRLTDYEALRESAPHFAGFAAVQATTAMQDGVAMRGSLVTGNYFNLLGARASKGRLLGPDDATTPGAAPVVVLSDHAWRSRYGADPAIIGKQITLGQRRFEVVGVRLPSSNLPGEETIAFWAPRTMAQAFGAADPWSDSNPASLSVIGRLRAGAGESRARTWFDLWLRNRFPAGSDTAAVGLTLESRATRIPWNSTTLTLFAMILSVFAFVLLVACANVANLVLARALGRQQEIALRLSLGASRMRIVSQLVAEGLVLAIPAAIVALVLTLVTARAFPALIIATFPAGVAPIEAIMAPLEPDFGVIAVLVVAAILSAVLVNLVPAGGLTHVSLVRASRGEASLDLRRSRLRTSLVALQVSASVLFLVAASGLVDETRRLANLDLGLSYERVEHVRIDSRLRAAVAARLASEPSVDRIAAAWQPPLDNSLPQITVRASETQVAQPVGFMAVSDEYFALFDIPVVRGRQFTRQEADEDAPVALVSQATARTLWPGRDPIGQRLELLPSRGRESQRRPGHTAVEVIGVADDVVTGNLMDGVDDTCVYFATSIRAPGEMTMLVRGRGNTAAVRTAVTTAVNAIEQDAPFQFFSIRSIVGGVAWLFQAVSGAASLLGAIGLLFAFSGTYAVVAFLVTQRTREFGVRMAVGATVRQIILGMLVETLRTASIGLAAGLALAVGLSSTLSGLVPIVPSFGLRSYLVATAVVLVSTTVAALIPSLRTARIDPSQALRVQ